MPPLGTRRSPTRASLGIASLSISSLFVFSPVPKVDSPVTLPPGRARLPIKPAATGSATFVITMGMVVIAFFAANAGGAPRPQLDQPSDEPAQPQAQASLQSFDPQIGTRW